MRGWGLGGLVSHLAQRLHSSPVFQYCSLLLPHGLWNGLPVLCRFLVLQTSCSFLLVRMGLTFFSLGYSLNAIPLYLQRLMLLQLQTQCKLFLQKCPRCSRERPGLWTHPPGSGPGSYPQRQVPNYLMVLKTNKQTNKQTNLFLNGAVSISGGTVFVV